MKQETISRKRYFEIFKKISIKSCLSPFIFILLLCPSIIFRIINKIRKKELWLIAEDGEARDNGYWLYKYIREEHKDRNCFYAVKKNSPSEPKINALGNEIAWGSLRHWLYYMSADLNISSQKSGNPEVLFWYFLHVKLHMYNNRVFIQHGITHNNVSWLNYKNARFKKFICGAKREYEFVKSKFGYKDEDVVLLGFSRWDAFKLKTDHKVKNILIMPTWRNWIVKYASDDEFLNSEYYKKWSELLNDSNFIKYIEDNDYNVFFFPYCHLMRYFLVFVDISI